MTNHTSNSTNRTLAIIDGAIADADRLIAGLSPNVDVLILDPSQDGIAQISEALAGRSNLTSLQLFTHGTDNTLQLGSTQLTTANLDTVASQIAQWSAALAESADILLYGCEVASDSTALIDRLSQLTGADVAASTNLTGAGGDWILEAATGAIEATNALRDDAMALFSGRLNIITVTTTADSGPGSLRAAINGAQSGDIIRFSSSLANQTITLTSGQIGIATGKNLTIDGSGAVGLTISGGNQSRIFYLNSTSATPTTLTVKNLTLANGYTNDRGGAISTTHQGNLIIENVTFSGNVADNGGGAIFSAFEGTLTVTGSRFYSNKAIAGNDERGAGAIAFWGPRNLTVRNSEFVNNQGINGGALNSLNGKLTVENSKFINNTTTAAKYDSGQSNPSLRGYGGAIYTDRASSTSESSGFIRITGSVFEGNKGRGEGGAAYLFTGKQDSVTILASQFKGNSIQALSGGNNGNGGALTVMSNENNRGLTISGTTFANNTATGQGGGLWMMKAPATITNSTFSGNAVTGTSSSNVGGGMALYGSATLVNTTIAYNSAGWVAGGVAVSGDAAVTAKNTIFYNNTANNGGNDWKIQQQTNRALNDGGGNVQFPGYLSNQFNRFNDNLAVQNIRIADARLGPLQNNGGGFLLTHALLSGSAAINAGVLNGAPATDQRGLQRDGKVDVGAFEFGAIASGAGTSTGGSTSGGTVVGTSLDDTLVGTNFKDTLSGRGGNDVLIGGRAGDVLTGGFNSDRFVYAGLNKRNAFANSRVGAPDRITDFKFLQGDKIVLDWDNNPSTVNLPTGLFNAGKVTGSNLSAATRAAFADKNQKRGGKQALAAHQAVFFKWGSSTYLAVNDQFKAFDGNRDMVVNVTGIRFGAGHATGGVLPVMGYFA